MKVKHSEVCRCFICRFWRESEIFIDPSKVTQEQIDVCIENLSNDAQLKRELNENTNI